MDRCASDDADQISWWLVLPFTVEVELNAAQIAHSDN